MAPTLAVLSQSGQTLSFFSLFTYTLTAHLPSLPAEPHELCFDPARNLLYASHTYTHGHFWLHGAYVSSISIICLTTKQHIGSISVSPALGPHGLHLDTHSDTLYASVEALSGGEGGGIIGIDLSTHKVVKKVASDSKPHWFVLTPDARKAYTCNKTQPWISVLDMEGQRAVRKIPVRGSEEPSMSRDGRFAYFPTPGTTLGAAPENPCVLIVDTKTDEVVGEIPTGWGAQSVFVTARGMILVGKYRFAAEGGAAAGRLGVYDEGTLRELGEVEVGGMPLTIRASEDGRWAFVACIFAGTVSVVDLEGMEVVRPLEVDTVRDAAKEFHQGAHGMAVLP